MYAVLFDLNNAYEIKKFINYREFKWQQENVYNEIKI